MRVSYKLPSGDYNIILTKEELNALVTKKFLHDSTGRTKCITSRTIYDSENKCMVSLDKKEIDNNLFMHINEDVADIKAGNHWVQFINIIVED